MHRLSRGVKSPEKGKHRIFSFLLCYSLLDKLFPHMLYLFLDESGDLGFDFAHKKPSRYFVICILTVKGQKNRKLLKTSIRRTLKNKLNFRRRYITELKASSSVVEIKEYVYHHAQKAEFSIYALILNKKKSYVYLEADKNHVYNYITRLLLDCVPVEDATTKVELIVDRSKSKREIAEFNKYIIANLQSRITPEVPLKIYHSDSQEAQELQMVDMFAWGIFRKYEKNDIRWYNIFKERIQYEKVTLNIKEPGRVIP